MSYEPTQWSAGDTVTSAKLNKMEQGIANASTGGGATSPTANLVAIMDSNGQLDKTWQEICDENIFFVMQGSGPYRNYKPIASMYPSDNYYIFLSSITSSSVSTITLAASTPDDYPKVTSYN